MLILFLISTKSIGSLVVLSAWPMTGLIVLDLDILEMLEGGKACLSTSSRNDLKDEDDASML